MARNCVDKATSSKCLEKCNMAVLPALYRCTLTQECARPSHRDVERKNDRGACGEREKKGNLSLFCLCEHSRHGGVARAKELEVGVVEHVVLERLLAVRQAGVVGECLLVVARPGVLETCSGGTPSDDRPQSASNAHERQVQRATRASEGGVERGDASDSPPKGKERKPCRSCQRPWCMGGRSSCQPGSSRSRRTASRSGSAAARPRDR